MKVNITSPMDPMAYGYFYVFLQISEVRGSFLTTWECLHPDSTNKYPLEKMLVSTHLKILVNLDHFPEDRVEH